MVCGVEMHFDRKVGVTEENWKLYLGGAMPLKEL